MNWNHNFGTFFDVIKIGTAQFYHKFFTSHFLTEVTGNWNVQFFGSNKDDYKVGTNYFLISAIHIFNVIDPIKDITFLAV